jgi:hypothetical protein
MQIAGPLTEAPFCARGELAIEAVQGLGAEVGVAIVAGVAAHALLPSPPEEPDNSA